MRFVLNGLAVVAPNWLEAHSNDSWVERYRHRIEENRLPTSQAGRLRLAEVVGTDGWQLLTVVFDPLAPAFLREIPAVQVLRQIWLQNYSVEDGRLRWREVEDIPPATLFINSPYETASLFRQKALHPVD
jgi:transposase